MVIVICLNENCVNMYQYIRGNDDNSVSSNDTDIYVLK